MSESKDVSYTAFLTACSRAKFPELSRDSFAHHWCSNSAWEKHAEYISKSPKWEAELICLRNRFFLEDSQRYFGGSGGVVWLLGSGFTSLAYLLSESIETVEIDSKQVIDHKKKTAKSLVERGLLPRRRVHYFAQDLNSTMPLPESWLPNSLLTLPSYFILEGLVYYLHRESLKNIFEWMSNFPSERLRVGLTFWKPDMAKNQFLINYQKFLESSGMSSQLNFYMPKEMREWGRFSKVVEDCEYLDLAVKFGMNPRFTSNSEVFGENFVVFEK